MANVERVWIGDFPLEIREETLQERLGHYDLNADGILDDQDAVACDPETPDFFVADSTQRNIAILQRTLKELNYEPLPIELFGDLRDVCIDVSQAHQMIAGLKNTPHDVTDFRLPCLSSCDVGFVEYEYAPDVWHNQVLPLVGGSTQSYQTRLERAAARYRDFAERHLHFTSPEFINVGSEHGTIANYPIWTKVDVGNVSALLQPTVIGITMMMSEIADWHWPEPGGPIAQIECEGSRCPDDDESERFYLTPKCGGEDCEINPATESFSLAVIGADLCYVVGEQSDATCYHGSFNPHVKLGFSPLLGLGSTHLYARDERSGNWDLGIYNALDIFERGSITN